MSSKFKFNQITQVANAAALRNRWAHPKSQSDVCQYANAYTLAFHCGLYAKNQRPQVS